jgi:hypothetical protein
VLFRSGRELIDTRFMETVIQSFVKERGAKYRAAGGLGKRRGQSVWGAARQAFATGEGWFAKRTPKGAPVYNIHTDHWKTFARERMIQGEDARGALLIYGDNAAEHRAIAKHFLAERWEAAKGQWVQIGRNPNHWWDCLAGCMVALNMCGASLINEGKKIKAAAKTVSLKEWRKR